MFTWSWISTTYLCLFLINPSSSATNRQTHLIQLATRGKFQQILNLLPTSTRLDLIDDNRQSTIIHHILRTQFNKFNANQITTQDFELYKTTLKQLTKHIDSSIYCPIVDAVHYRFKSTVKILLASMSRSKTIECLQERDINGDNVLHVASKSKASGFARQLLTKRRNNHRNNREVGIQIIPDADETASFLQLNNPSTVNSQDLDLLLKTGKQNYIDMYAWIRVRNVIGETPLMVACRSGRSDIVATFLRSSLETSVNIEEIGRERQYNMTCAHVAATHGHLKVLKLLLQKEKLHVVINNAGNIADASVDHLMDEDVVLVNDKIDMFGRTVLDVACQSARKNIVMYLYDIAINKNQFVQHCLNAARNVTNGEVERLSCLFNSNKSNNECDQQLGTEDSKRNTQTNSPTQIKVSTGDWNIGTENNAKESIQNMETSTTTTIASIEFNHTNLLFIRDFYTLKRPVVVRNALINSKTKKEWIKSTFLKQYGSEQIEVSKIPHGKTYGYKSQRTTISKYIQSWKNQDDKENQAQPYLFDGGKLWHTSNIKIDVGPADLGILNLTKSPHIYLYQFHLGNHGTGAQFHFHGEAMNGLVYGRKQWTFIPLNCGVFTIKSYKIKKNRKCMEYAIVQRSGDVVYVPEFWSHTTENLGEAIGFAFEFY